MPFITNMICTEYTNHQYKLCELRDGVAHCGVVNRTNIYSLLEVYVLINKNNLYLYITGRIDSTQE